VSSGSATVTPTVDPTDASGNGSAQVTCGATAGPIAITVSRVDDPTVSVVFNASCSSVPTLTISSGDGQTTGINQTFAAPLDVLAENSGSPASGLTINWTVTSGSATVSPTSVTNGLGHALVTVTAGNTAGPVVITGSRADAPSVAVSFNLNVASPTLVIVSGNNQTGYPNQAGTAPLVVEMRDGTPANNPVVGATIFWNIVAGGVVLGAPSSVTDASGRASMTFTYGGAGFTDIKAHDGGFLAVQFSVQALDPTLVITSGNNQTAPVNTTVPQPLHVQALDDGAPAVGKAINWTVLSGDATVVSNTGPTDASGFSNATVAFGPTPGPVQIQAARADNPTALVVFDLTSTLTRTLTIASGDAQNAQAGNAFAAPLVVLAQDNGAAASGITINWAVTSGSATLSASSSVTDVAGNAQVGLTAGAIAGPVTVTGTRADDPTATVTFNATVSALPVLAIVSGDGQSGMTSTVADLPLVVSLTDGLGNPIAGQTVNWAISGAGTLSGNSSVTDAAGHAQVTLTFAASAGAITVTASTAGGPAPVNFTATAVSGSIGIASGDGQTGPINSTLPLPLKVVVNPPAPAPVGGGRVRPDALNGVPVTFTVTSGGGSVSQTTVMTDVNGEASTVFTLGPTPGLQTVSAAVAGGSSVTFTATAVLNRTLTLVSGNAQTGAPGSTLPAPLVVHAQDNGADAAGINILWSVVSGSGSVAPPTTATNTNGLAQATVTLGATPGTITIRATRADDATVFVNFTAGTSKLQNIPGLDPDELDLAIVLDEACSALAALSSPTPEQADLLARCQDLIDSSIIDPDSTIDALDELLPDMALAMAEASFNAAQSQFQNLKARIAALRSGTQGNGFNGLALNGPGGTVSLGSLASALTGDGDADAPKGEVGADFSRWGFFASGTIGRGEAEEGSVRPAYDYDINGLTVGIDYRKSDKLIFGAALGYTKQDAELRGQPGNMDMSGWSVSAYGTYYRDNSWYSDGVITWGHNTFDLLRRIRYTIPLPGGGTSVIDQTARSNSDGDMIEGAFTFGRDFQAGGWSIGPYGRVLYTRLSFDEIEDEMDPGVGSGLGLVIDSRELTSIASEIGAKFTYAHSTDWGVVTPHFQIEWEHEFKDDPKSMTARFLADPTGSPFTLSGEEIDSDYFRLSLGLSIIMQRGRSGFLIYEKTVGRNGFDQSNLGFGIRIEF
jgi:uncharacterized protein with beta-barrel porin domain